MKELWKPIIEFEEFYHISSFGRVKSLRNNIILKGDTGKHGHKRVVLFGKNFKQRILVHRLVALHFLKKPDKFNIVNHLDSNPSNNKVNNLEWTDIRGNTIHALNNNRLTIPKGSKNGRSVLKEADVIKIFDLRKKGLTQLEIANILHVSRSCIAHVTQGNRWKHLKEKNSV